MITYEELLDILYYDPLTGEFTWVANRGTRARAGGIAGFINKGKDNYRIIKINSKAYKAHRLAFLLMTGKFPDNQVDHINGIKYDNVWDNLRDVTNSENQKNRTLTSTSTSGVMGVTWAANRNKWHSQIAISMRCVHLGYFDVLQEAIDARKAAEEIHGFHKNHGRAA